MYYCNKNTGGCFDNFIRACKDVELFVCFLFPYTDSRKGFRGISNTEVASVVEILPLFNIFCESGKLADFLSHFIVPCVTSFTHTGAHIKTRDKRRRNV